MNLWFDLRYAWRLLWKSPGYTLLCTGVVALSVGLAIWCYVGIYSMELKPLPFPGSDRWWSVQVAANATATGDPQMDAYTYQELLKRQRSLHYLGAFADRPVVLSEGQASNSLRAAAISPVLFSGMEVAPRLGRLFQASDAEQNAAPTVILSFDTWQNYFGADPAIIGKSARIDGQPAQIVGVMPREFLVFRDFEVWIPLRLAALAQPGDSNLTLSVFATLEPGRSAAAALDEMKGPVEEINHNYPKLFEAGRHVELYPAHLMYAHDNLPLVSMVGFIGAAVLLLGSLNISMVFFARLLERSRELALRTALGSSRLRLLRQCLLESVFVIVLGLLLGVLFAELGLRWAQAVGDFHAQLEATGRQTAALVMRPIDLVAAVVAASVIWLLSTLIPAWRIARQDAAAVLAGSGKGVATPGSGRTATLLVGLEVIVSCLVLVICANVVFAVSSKAGTPTGLHADRVMISTYPTVFDTRYAAGSMRLRYWDELASSIKTQMPGAEVAFAAATPTRPESMPAAIEHREGTSGEGKFTLPLSAVSEQYFQVMGLQLREGRLFDSTDNESSLNVAIVDENTAAKYWSGVSALGKRIQLNPAESGPWLTIVGVVSHVGGRPYADESVGVVYRPFRQAVPGEFQLLTQFPPAVADPRAALRAAAYSVDRDLPLQNLQMFNEYLDSLNLDYKSLVPVFTVIAIITVILAATGLFGLISRSVARRTQEVGVRRALGGTRWHVAQVFLRQDLLYLGVGIVGGCLGIAVTNLLSESIPDLLVRVVPVTLGVFVIIGMVIFVSSYLPTRRAVDLEPGDALRYE